MNVLKEALPFGYAGDQVRKTQIKVLITLYRKRGIDVSSREPSIEINNHSEKTVEIPNSGGKREVWTEITSLYFVDCYSAVKSS